MCGIAFKTVFNLLEKGVFEGKFYSFVLFEIKGFSA
jgi:hypothetical protein